MPLAVVTESVCLKRGRHLAGLTIVTQTGADAVLFRVLPDLLPEYRLTLILTGVEMAPLTAAIFV